MPPSTKKTAPAPHPGDIDDLDEIVTEEPLTLMKEETFSDWVSFNRRQEYVTQDQDDGDDAEIEQTTSHTQTETIDIDWSDESKSREFWPDVLLRDLTVTKSRTSFIVCGEIQTNMPNAKSETCTFPIVLRSHVDKGSVFYPTEVSIRLYLSVHDEGRELRFGVSLLNLIPRRLGNKPVISDEHRRRFDFIATTKHETRVNFVALPCDDERVLFMDKKSKRSLTSSKEQTSVELGTWNVLFFRAMDEMGLLTGKDKPTPAHIVNSGGVRKIKISEDVSDRITDFADTYIAENSRIIDHVKPATIEIVPLKDAGANRAVEFEMEVDMQYSVVALT